VTNFDEWLKLQNGFEPRGMPDGATCKYDPKCGMQPEDPDPSDKRGYYIRNLRDLSHYVHFDDLPQEFLNACLILKHLGVPPSHGPACAPQPHGPVDPGNPYLSYGRQEAFATFGDQFILTLVAEVARRALYAAWYQKWIVHRRLRPEEFGGRIHRQKEEPTLDYKINSEILNSQVLTEIKTKFDSYLLPQAYIEGSPIHPEFPSGHATIAGACVTILKAYFDENFEFEESYQSDSSGKHLIVATNPDGTPLTENLIVGHELNKLASNIAIGRNAAGVHFRSGYYQGVLLGEKVAIGLLEDLKDTFKENFEFRFTMFNGTPKIIKKP
jgi:membrane-associated phospholipid phosphatase